MFFEGITNVFDMVTNAGNSVIEFGKSVGKGIAQTLTNWLPGTTQEGEEKAEKSASEKSGKKAVKPVAEITARRRKAIVVKSKKDKNLNAYCYDFTTIIAVYGIGLVAISLLNSQITKIIVDRYGGMKSAAPFIFSAVFTSLLISGQFCSIMYICYILHCSKQNEIETRSFKLVSNLSYANVIGIFAAIVATLIHSLVALNHIDTVNMNQALKNSDMQIKKLGDDGTKMSLFVHLDRKNVKNSLSLSVLILMSLFFVHREAVWIFVRVYLS